MSGRDPFSDYRRLLDARGFRPSRRLGQNFLLDPSLHRVVAEAVPLGPADTVLEVGSGLGFLTRELARRCRRVVAVEVDERLCAVLREELARMPHGERVEVLCLDVLADGALAPAVAEALRGSGEYAVVANLPYAIAGPFLVAALTADPGPPRSLAAVVQAEFADRLRARPGTGDYGSLSVVVQAGYRVERLRTISREVFRPRPRVDSALVRMTARTDSMLHGLPAPARRAFAECARLLFGQRRKTLRNAVLPLQRALGRPVDAGALGDLGGRRPQSLTPEEAFGVCARLLAFA